MMDERIVYEPITESGQHYVVVTMTLDKISPQKADGRTRQDAAEAGISMLIDLCDCLFDESEDLRARLAEAERVKRLEDLVREVAYSGFDEDQDPRLGYEETQLPVGTVHAALAALEVTDAKQG